MLFTLQVTGLLTVLRSNELIFSGVIFGALSWEKLAPTVGCGRPSPVFDAIQTQFT